MKLNINKFIFALLMVAPFALSGCDNENDVKNPSYFKVDATGSEYFGDTIVVDLYEAVKFGFSANPNQILFYSGELGQEYRFAQRGYHNPEDGTDIQSKVTVMTSVNTLDATTVRTETYYALYALEDMKENTPLGFSNATKTELKRLRATGINGANITDSYTFDEESDPMAILNKDLNLAIMAKSKDATVNYLTISANGFSVINSEKRDYGYNGNGIEINNIKTQNYTIIAANSFVSAHWVQHAPDMTIPVGESEAVQNAFGYTWNMGEIGVDYFPDYKDGPVNPNKSGNKLAGNYPVSVTKPTEDYPELIVDPKTQPYEAWLISCPVNPSAVTNDKVTTVIKKENQSSIYSYQYVYKEKGMYKASFIGFNSAKNGEAKVVREFVIIVK